MMKKGIGEWESISKGALAELLYNSYYDYHFKNLIQMYLPKLKRTVMASGIPESDAEDICSEVFLGGWILIATRQLRKQVKLETLFYVITERRIADFFRLKYKKRDEFRHYMKKIDEDLFLRNEDDIDLFNEWIKIEDKVTNTLSPRQRQIFSYFIGGLSQKEIAQALGISARNVHNTINIAKRKVLKIAGSLKELRVI